MVAKLPFKPVGVLKNLAYHSLDQSSIRDESFGVGGTFLFVLIFISFKTVIRKSMFDSSERIVPQGSSGVSVPIKALYSFNSTMSWDELFHNFLGLILSSWYSLYAIYKAAKKYNNAKYVVSITRNVSRLTGWICSLYVPYPLRYVMYGGFAKTYGINMEEVEYPDFGHYETFTKFFTRHLKAGVREVSEPNCDVSMCSPCDGTVLTCGKINS